MSFRREHESSSSRNVLFTSGPVRPTHSPSAYTQAQQSHTSSSPSAAHSFPTPGASTSSPNLPTPSAQRTRAATTSVPGVVTKHLVIECTKDNEALTSALLSFLETFTAPQHLPHHRQSGQWYYGDCRVIRHGEGTCHNGNKVIRGVWEHNVYKGGPFKDSLHLPLSSADVAELEDEGVMSPPLSPPRTGAKERTPVVQLLQSSNKSMTPLGSTIHECFFPDELLHYIFSFLDIQSLCKCGTDALLPFLLLLLCPIC